MGPLAGTATTYDIIYGRISELRPDKGLAHARCIADDWAALTFVDMRDAGVGDGWWYVVRGVNACGLGSWGFQSDGRARRPGPASCP